MMATQSQLRYMKKYYQRVRKPKYQNRELPILAQSLKGKAQQRAKKKNLPYELTTEWVLERLEKGICEATGVPLDLKTIRGAYSPSIDQKEAGKGYTEENSQLVVLIYNLCKAKWEHSIVIDFAKRIAKET